MIARDPHKRHGRSAPGTFETCRPTLKMSAYRTKTGSDRCTVRTTRMTRNGHSVGRPSSIKPRRHESTLARTHETENTGLRREAKHGAVRRVVDSVDDPIRRDPQPEWNRHLPTTID